MHPCKYLINDYNFVFYQNESVVLQYEVFFTITEDIYDVG